MNTLSSFWKYGRKYCSIEHRTCSNGEQTLYVLTAHKKNQEFEVEDTFTENSIFSLTQKIKKNQHCFLTITGNQVLLKSTLTKGNEKKIVGAAFPNIDTADFYYQILRTSTQNIVAICRKENVDEILDNYRKAHLQILGFSLGFFSIYHLLGLLENNKIYLSHFVLGKNAHDITSFEKDESEEEVNYSLADTSVSSNYLLSLASLFNYETGIKNSVSNFSTKNSELKKAHEHEVLFRKGSLVGTGFLVLSLLLNFFLYFSYYTHYQQLEEQYHYELSQKETFDKKNQEILKKEQIISNIFANSNSKSSFFLNKINSAKPSEILFNEFIYQPLVKKVKAKEPIEIDENLISISGESYSEPAFTEWIKSLEKTPWIQGVKITDFSYKTNRISEFTLLLNLNKDDAIQ